MHLAKLSQDGVVLRSSKELWYTYFKMGLQELVQYVKNKLSTSKRGPTQGV
jgi:hypothetical protein